MMDNYEQHMKHWKNHRKDRFTQQCGGPTSKATHNPISENYLIEAEYESFTRILEEAQRMDFPIWIANAGGWHWFICDEKNLFGNRIESYEELVTFGNEYVYQ